MKTLTDLIYDYAAKAHGKQQRKFTPEAYIVHPLRVMKTCKQFTEDACILSAALLHDVLEDTAVKKEEMDIFLHSVMDPEKAGRTLQLVVELTDVYVKKNYPHLNRRTRKAKELARLEKTSADSQTIKYADIKDNAAEIVVQDPDFARLYLSECRTILKKLDKGNADLYREVVEQVNRLIESLDQ